MYPRNTLLYWLVDVEGIDGVTAGRIIAMDRRYIDPLPEFPDIADKIQAAYDGLYAVNNDC